MIKFEMMFFYIFGEVDFDSKMLNEILLLSYDKLFGVRYIDDILFSFTLFFFVEGTFTDDYFDHGLL